MLLLLLLSGRGGVESSRVESGKERPKSIVGTMANGTTTGIYRDNRSAMTRTNVGTTKPPTTAPLPVIRGKTPFFVVRSFIRRRGY